MMTFPPGRGDAAKSHYQIKIEGLHESQLQVLSWESEAHQLCDDYQLTIRVLTQRPLETAPLLGQGGRFSLWWGASEQHLSGILVGLSSHGQSLQGYHYTLRLASPLARLKYSRHNRVFTRLSVLEAVKKVMASADFPLASLHLPMTGRPVAMIVQYDETDYDFVTRLLRKHGYVYAFEETLQGAQLHICEHSRELSAIIGELSLCYHAVTGQVRAQESIFSVCRQHHLLTDAVALDDYDYQQPGQLEVQQHNRSRLPGVGQDERYGEHYQSIEQGELLARVRQQSLDAQRELLLIESDCRALRPGLLLTIYDHPEFSGAYLVIGVDHRGDQGGSVNYGRQRSGTAYTNQARLLSVMFAYQAPVPANRRVFATFNATIEQEVDEMGRYLVKFPFEHVGDGPTSCPARLIQAYGGAGHGMHFPLTAGTEVLLCGENGDLDRPVILGALFNGQSPNPVTSINPTENTLVTRSGHRLLMDDKAGREKIQIATRDLENSLLLDANKQGNHASLVSESGDVTISAHYDLHWKAEGDQHMAAGGHMIMRVGQDVRIQTGEGDINLEAATGATVKADGQVHLESVDGPITLQSAAGLTMQSVESAALTVTQGDIELLASAGNLDIEAGHEMILKGSGTGKVHIGQGEASIEIDAGGNLSIDAKRITLSATNIVLRGSAISDN